MTSGWSLPSGSLDRWPEDYERGRPGYPAALYGRWITIMKSHLNLPIPIALLLLATAAIAAPSDKQAKDGSAPLQLPRW